MLRCTPLLWAPAQWKFQVITQRITAWYPRKGGEFLGNLLAGHNLFIQDIPKRFDKQHARHFSLVEALTIGPLFTLSMVHYCSIFGQYHTRTQLLEELLLELSHKSHAQRAWLAVLQERSPTDVVAWRLALLALQMVMFPLQLLVSSAAPQLMHATLQHTNHILQTKYGCIADGAPAFVGEMATRCRHAQERHEKGAALPTDLIVAVVMFLMILYVSS